MTATPTIREGMSLDEFLELNAQQPFELINGERIPLMPTVYGHSEVIQIVFIALYMFIQARKLGKVEIETTFIVRDQDEANWVKGSRVPDIMVYAGDQIEQFKATHPDYRERPIPYVPDLVIEVVSPTDKIVELDTKIEAYLADGVRLIWVIYPHSRKAIIYAPDAEQPRHLNINGILDGEDVLPGFQLPVAKIFE
ncbi:MAG: Uma2 family endonuclease [Anaerolineae bacterium]|nr:Uma2 family endonuclease [Anaerolineae bacterium]